MAKTNRATLIRILTEIAEDKELAAGKRLEAVKLAIVLKGKAGRAALDKVDPEMARLIEDAKSQ